MRSAATFVLKTQEPHDVGPLERLVKVLGNRDAPVLNINRQQGTRRGDAHFGAESPVRRNVTASDATVANITDYQHAESGEHFTA